MWLNDGLVGSEQVLTHSFVKAAQSEISLLPPSPRDSINLVKIYYGYGWGNWNHNGNTQIQHSGGLSGYVSNVVMYPELDFGLVVLSNQTTSSLPSRITNRIIERLHPELKQDSIEVGFGQAMPPLANETPTIQDPNDVPDYELTEVLGEYHHPGFGSFTTTLEDKTLFAHFPLAKFRLEYVGDNVFFDHHAEEMPYVYWNFMRLQFEKNDAGQINRVLINLDNEPVEFLKQ